MNLKSIFENALEWGREHERKVVLGLFLVLGIFIGWVFGRFSGDRAPAIIIDKNIRTGLPFSPDLFKSGEMGYNLSAEMTGNFVASINGTAFYPKGCKAAERIKEENKIWFNTAEEALAQGYKPAASCQ